MNTQRLMKVARTSLFGLFTALALAGCAKTEEVVRDSGDEELVLKFKSNIPAASTSRALSESQENMIATVDVLAFNEVSSNNFEFAYRTYGTVDPDNSGSQTVIRVKVRPTDGGKHNYVLLANLREEVDKLFAAGDIDEGLGKDEAMELITFEAFSATAASDEDRKWDTGNPPRYLPMWGDNGKAYSISSSNDIETITGVGEDINMLRAVARVDVKFDETTTENNFLPTKVMVYRAGQSGYAAPHKDNYSATDRKVSLPTLPGGISYADILHTVQDASTLKDDPARKFEVASEIYITESLIKDVSDPLDPEDRTGILIAGVYAPDGDFAHGTETWYRLDFYHRKNAGDPGTLVDILRNYHYKFTVTRIEGDGYPDPETAAKSEPINIDDYVLDWEEDFGMDDIWYDGHTMFGVSPSNIDISEFGTGDTPQVIRIVTNSVFTNVSCEYVAVPGGPEYVYDPADLGYTPVNQYSFLNPADVGFSGPTTKPIYGKDGVEYTFAFEVPPYKNTYEGPSPRKMRVEFTFADDDGNVRMVVPVTISQKAMGWYVDDFFYVYEEKNGDYRTRKIHMYAKGNFDNLMVKASFNDYEGIRTFPWLGHRVEFGIIKDGENPYKQVYEDYYATLSSSGKESMLREIDEYSSTIVDLPQYGDYNFTTYEILPWQYGYEGSAGIASFGAMCMYIFSYSFDGGVTWQPISTKAYADDPHCPSSREFYRQNFHGSRLYPTCDMNKFPPHGIYFQTALSGDETHWELQFSGSLTNVDEETVSLYAVVEKDNGDTEIVGKYTFTSSPNNTIVDLPVAANETSEDRTIELYVSIGGEEESKIRPYYLEYQKSGGGPDQYYHSITQNAQ